MGVSCRLGFNNPDGVATAVACLGEGLSAKVGQPTAIFKLRKQVNALFTEPYKKAIAYVLCAHPADRKFEVEEIFALLDDTATPSLYAGRSWNWFHRNYKNAAEQCVSKIRAALRKNGTPCN